MVDNIFAFFSRKPSRGLIFLIFLVFCAYANSLYSPFVLDDIHSFIDEPAVYNNDFSLESLKKLAATKFGPARLIPMITFSVDHYLFSLTDSIAQYHLTNILIHILATLAVFFLLGTLANIATARKDLHYFPPLLFALLITSFWALNPVQTNVVTYIVQRMASICALFYILSLAFYLSARQTANRPRKRLALFLLAVLTGLLAFISKENSLTLPAAILFSEYLFFSFEKTNRFVKSIKPSSWLLLVLALTIFAPLLEPVWHKYTSHGARPFTLGERLLTESRIVIFYISLLFLPLQSRLNFEHDYPISTGFFSPPETILSILLIILLLSIAIYNLNRNKLISFGIVFYFLTIFIESSFIPLELIFEHRLYLPSLGLFIAVFAALDISFRKFKGKDQEVTKLVVLTFIFILSLSSISTTLRNKTWQDRTTLALDTYQKSPDKPRALANYGTALFQEKRYDEAIEVLNRCLQFSDRGNENFCATISTLIMIYIEKGDPRAAIEIGYDFLQKPDFLNFNLFQLDSLLHNLSIALHKEGRYEEAKNAKIGAIQFPTSESNLRTELEALQRLLTFMALNRIKETDIVNFPTDYQNLPGPIREKLNDEVYLEIGEIAVNLRKYEMARMWLAKVEQGTNNREASELHERIAYEEALNAQHARDYDIVKAINNNPSLSYRTCLKLSRFIISNYKPLLPLVKKLLDRAEKISGPDPYLAYLRIIYLSRQNNRQEAVAYAELSRNNYPDFVPILDLLVNMYSYKTQRQQKLAVINHILEIFPASQNWMKYERLLSMDQKSPQT